MFALVAAPSIVHKFSPLPDKADKWRGVCDGRKTRSTELFDMTVFLVDLSSEPCGCLRCRSLLSSGVLGMSWLPQIDVCVSRAECQHCTHPYEVLCTCCSLLLVKSALSLPSTCPAHIDSPSCLLHPSIFIFYHTTPLPARTSRLAVFFSMIRCHNSMFVCAQCTGALSMCCDTKKNKDRHRSRSESNGGCLR